jgi:hypothetical protein
MAVSAFTGPVVSFGQASSSDNNPQAASSLFWAGTALLDPRSQFTYQPGSDVTAGAYGWAGDSTSIISLYAVPATKSATLIAAAAHTVNGTAMVLASAAATGINVGVSVVRIDTGVNVTGLLEIDPLVASCTASVTSGSNILTVTAMGTGTGYHPVGLTPNMVLTDATHASAIPTGTFITGFISGGGGIGTYTMSANAASTQTGDTVTGLYSTTPHAQAFGQAGTVRLWNPAAMCSRTLLITCNNASGATTTFTVNGLDVYGQPMTEQIVVTPGTALTTAGLKAWKFIKSITPNATDATYTFSVGTNDVVGLPIRSDNFQTGATIDLSLMMNNALISATTGYLAGIKTTATATTGDVRGTYALQTSSNGTLLVAATHAPLTPNLNSAIGLYGVPQYAAW